MRLFFIFLLGLLSFSSIAQARTIAPPSITDQRAVQNIAANDLQALIATDPWLASTYRPMMGRSRLSVGTPGIRYAGGPFVMDLILSSSLTMVNPSVSTIHLALFYEVATLPNLRIISRPNPPQIRNDVATANQAAPIALRLAADKLRTLDRFRFWQQRAWRYHSAVYAPNYGSSIQSDPAVWTVVYDVDNGVSDQQIIIRVNVQTRQIVDVRLGMA